MKKQQVKVEDLLSSAIKEQQFYRLKCEYLLSVLNEIKTFTGTLEQSVIDNALERNQLDNLIHTKLLFKD